MAAAAGREAHGRLPHVPEPGRVRRRDGAADEGRAARAERPLQQVLRVSLRMFLLLSLRLFLPAADPARNFTSERSRAFVAEFKGRERGRSFTGADFASDFVTSPRPPVEVQQKLPQWMQDSPLTMSSGT